MEDIKGNLGVARPPENCSLRVLSEMALVKVLKPRPILRVVSMRY